LEPVTSGDFSTVWAMVHTVEQPKASPFIVITDTGAEYTVAPSDNGVQITQTKTANPIHPLENSQSSQQGPNPLLGALISPFSAAGVVAAIGGLLSVVANTVAHQFQTGSLLLYIPVAIAG